LKKTDSIVFGAWKRIDPQRLRRHIRECGWGITV
jgi:hypothetical protein